MRIAEVTQPDYRRLTRATDPAILGPNPALFSPVENANQTLDKVIVTMNRGGSNPRNPILKGLGAQFQIYLAASDRLYEIYFYQDPADFGQNLKDQASSIGVGAWALNQMIGSGRTVAGTPATGAKRNFMRVRSKYGSFDKEFWAKDYDADVVAVDGKPCLDPATLQPVEIVAPIVDSTQDWLQLTIDFFVSWNDEFQVLHNAKNPYLDPGFSKAYGGAAFVSFFDTDPGTEGVGTEVNPVTQNEIKDQHLIEVENTVGLKEITVRFRSRKDSPYFVDVPILIRVVQEVVTCVPPTVLPCIDNLLKQGSDNPANTPSVPSEPGVPTVPGTEGVPLEQDLLIIAIKGAMVGGDPKLLVQRWKVVQDDKKLSGGGLQFYTSTEYIPMTLAGDVPNPGAPYQSPKIYAIALSVSAERAENIAAYTVQLKDGDLLSEAVAVMGPRMRLICSYPTGEQGGGAGCCGPAGCVGGPGEWPPPSPSYYYGYYGYEWYAYGYY